MNHRKISLAVLLSCCLGSLAVQAGQIQRALIISVDGLHALDVANYIKVHPGSALAQLTSHGVTYANARTPANSDSFPGLLALLTGGSPVSHDLFYDVSYDRTYFVNGAPDCSRVLSADDPTYGLLKGAPAGPGSTIAFDETIDLYGTDPHTGKPLSMNTINPASLPRRIDSNGNCVPVYPHNALKTNTIFEVVKAHGGVTAWADKHPAYEMVKGPSGSGLSDLYTPEITNVGGLDNTASVICTHENDHLKTIALINQIHGLTHDGHPLGNVPSVFGTDYQAVSVGQKLAADTPDASCVNSVTAIDAARLSGQPGGYQDGAGTPTDVLAYALDKVDADLEAIIDALQSQHLYDSTLFIVTAKHGQSPINPVKTNKPGHFADLVAGLGSVSGVTLSSEDVAAQNVLANAANCMSGPCGFVQDDDIALIWLPDQTQTASVARLINKYAKELYVDEVMAGNEIKLKFNDPMHDPRTPDIVVQPIYGTVYTSSTKKNAEHGGFSFGDTNVGLVLSNPGFRAMTIKTPATTAEVPVTILKALGINPTELQSVRAEHTGELPGFFN